MEHRPSGGPDQSPQDDQAPDVRACRFRTPPCPRLTVLASNCGRPGSMSCIKIAEEPAIIPKVPVENSPTPQAGGVNPDSGIQRRVNICSGGKTWKRSISSNGT